MKHIPFLLLLSICIQGFAGAPQAFTYQAIARDSTGNVLQLQQLGFRFTIHDGSATGTIVYQETDTVTTDRFGLLAIAIDSGIVVQGIFSNINWTTGNKYLQVELDPTGGTNYTNMGTSQLLSVPYALNTHKSDSSLFSNSSDSSLYALKSDTAIYSAKCDTALYAQSSGSGFTHYLGELYGGGIVFQVYKDSSGQEHGLIVALTLASDSAAWSNIVNTFGGAAGSSWNGAANTNGIIAQAGQTNSAALICKNYNGGGFSDWYLPSFEELQLFLSNSIYINQKQSNGAVGIIVPTNYWSSTEYDANDAWSFGIGTYYGNPVISPKGGAGDVRAVRQY